MRLLLVHIPKTAGNSIIFTYKDKGLKIWGHNLRNPTYRSFPRSKIGKLKKKFPDIINTFLYSFAVVRNPWERVYSAYNFLISGGLCEGDFEDYIKFIRPFNDFNDFVLHGLEPASKYQIHFKPQMYWIADDDGTIVVDKVIPLEEVNDELPQIMKEFKKNPQSLPYLNKGRKDTYRSFYLPQSIEMVARIYKDEIEEFQFSF